MQATAGRDGEKSSLSAMRKGSIEDNNMQSRKLGLTHLKAQTHTHTNKQQQQWVSQLAYNARKPQRQQQQGELMANTPKERKQVRKERRKK